MTVDSITAYDERRGSGTWAPVVLDSPHSGTDYPADFGASAPMAALRRGEDFLVDRLFDPGESGAHLLAARFPRTYVDPNRPADDIDPSLLDAPWPGEANPGPKSAVGKGLIWRLCLGEMPVYDRELSVAEVEHRITHYWRPYRERLSQLLDDAHARAGVVVHINCHSMPSLWPAGVEGAGTPVEADFLLGDIDGLTCGPRVREHVATVLRDQGFRVAINDRFKGVDIVRSSGHPEAGRHSLQIEVVRNRYMDEDHFEANEGYERMRAALSRLVDETCMLAGSLGA